VNVVYRVNRKQSVAIFPEMSLCQMRALSSNDALATDRIPRSSGDGWKRLARDGALYNRHLPRVYM
jgi:hypothetical protein